MPGTSTLISKKTEEPVPPVFVCCFCPLLSVVWPGLVMPLSILVRVLGELKASQVLAFILNFLESLNQYISKLA